MARDKKKPMKRVLIKRVKRPQKSIGTKAKFLAGLGVGATLAGFSGGSPKAGQNLKPIVRTQEQGKNSNKEKITKSLKDIFGVKEAKAGWDDGPGDWDGGDLSLSPQNSNFGTTFGPPAEYGGSVGAASQYTAQVLAQDPTDPASSVLLNSLQTNPSGQYSTPSPVSASNTVTDEQTLINNYIKDQEEKNGLKITQWPDGTYEVTGGKYGAYSTVSTQDMLKMAQLWSNPTPDPLANLPGSQSDENLQLLNPYPGSVGTSENGHLIYFNNGAYTDASGNVYGKYLENGVYVYRQNVIESPPAEVVPPVQQQNPITASDLGTFVSWDHVLESYGGDSGDIAVVLPDGTIYTKEQFDSHLEPGQQGPIIPGAATAPNTVFGTVAPIATIASDINNFNNQGQHLVSDPQTNLRQGYINALANKGWQVTFQDENSISLINNNGQTVTMPITQVDVNAQAYFMPGGRLDQLYPGNLSNSINPFTIGQGGPGDQLPGLPTAYNTNPSVPNANLQAVGEANGTTIYFNSNTGKFQDATGKHIYNGGYNTQGDYSFSEINQPGSASIGDSGNNQNVDTTAPVDLVPFYTGVTEDVYESQNLDPVVSPENLENPDPVNQSAVQNNESDDSFSPVDLDHTYQGVDESYYESRDAAPVVKNIPAEDPKNPSIESQLPDTIKDYEGVIELKKITDGDNVGKYVDKQTNLIYDADGMPTGKIMASGQGSSVYTDAQKLTALAGYTQQLSNQGRDVVIRDGIVYVQPEGQKKAKNSEDVEQRYIPISMDYITQNYQNSLKDSTAIDPVAINNSVVIKDQGVANTIVNAAGAIQEKTEEGMKKVFSTTRGLVTQDPNRPDGKAKDGTALYNLGTDKVPVWVDWNGNIFTDKGGTSQGTNLLTLTQAQQNTLFGTTDVSNSAPQTSKAKKVFKAITDPVGTAVGALTDDKDSKIVPDSYSSNGKNTPLYNVGTNQNPEYVDWYGFTYDAKGLPTGTNIDPSFKDNINLIKSFKDKIKDGAETLGKATLTGPRVFLQAATNNQTNWDKVVDWAFNPVTWDISGKVKFKNPNTGVVMDMSKSDVRSLIGGDEEQSGFDKMWGNLNKIKGAKP